jgi:hypothetical protein
MKIHQILDGISIIITNEERDFVSRLGEDIYMSSLDHHDQWLAQNLVRKGVYEISNDRKRLSMKDHETRNIK